MLMMVPLRRSLIVKEHGNLPYPEGTACASVLIAGEKGGDAGEDRLPGRGLRRSSTRCSRRSSKLIAEAPALVSTQTNKYFPSATLNGEITPEYLGVGYIIGPRIAGVLVAGGVLAWLGLIPLLASLVPPDTIAAQLVKLGYLTDLASAGGRAAGIRRRTPSPTRRARSTSRYVRQIGAGAVAAGGFITLLKTLPTIVSSLQGQPGLAARGRPGAAAHKRTERDLPITVVLGGSVGLVAGHGGPALPAGHASSAGCCWAC